MQDFPKPSLNRHSTRLAGFDYAQDGAYFITIVTQGRACLFGDIEGGEMVLNEAGLMVAQVCYEMPHVIRNMRWGIYQIMPNHFHAVVELHNAAGINQPHVGATLRGCPGQTRRSAPTGDPETKAPTGDPEMKAPTGDPEIKAPTGDPEIKAPTGDPEIKAPTGDLLSLGDVVGRFKSLTTRRYIDGVRDTHWPQFRTRLWQRNYYEHIIRDDTDYQSIFNYVICNPQNWEKDSEYPLE